MRPRVSQSVVCKLPITTSWRTRKSGALKSIVCPAGSILVNRLRFAWQKRLFVFLVDVKSTCHRFINHGSRRAFRMLTEITQHRVDELVVSWDGHVLTPGDWRLERAHCSC